MSTEGKNEDDGVTEDDIGTPMYEVESYRFDGRTRVFEKEMRRLKERAVEPTFSKPPRWIPAPMMLALAGPFIAMPLVVLIFLWIDEGEPCLMSALPVALPLIGGMFAFFYFLAYHEMYISPVDGRYGSADPEQAHRGLTLIVREVMLNEGYGFKLERVEAILSNNYSFTMMPAEGSKERFLVSIGQPIGTEKLKLFLPRGTGEKWSTYRRMKRAIEVRLARQVV